MARSLPRERADEPLIGWRVWKLRIEGSGSVVLAPAVYGPEGWTPRAAAVSTCSRQSHDSPMEGCRCGLHALRDSRGLRRLRWEGTVVGTVALWGRIVEHRRGYRSQFAYPQRMKLVCARCLRDGRASSAECVAMRTVRTSGSRATHVVAACARHARTRGTAPLDLSPREVQAALLSAYAVDLLPTASLEAGESRLARLPHRAASSIRIGVRAVPLLVGLAIVSRVVFLAAPGSPLRTPEPIAKPTSPRDLMAVATASATSRHLSMEAMRLLRTKCYRGDPDHVDPRCDQIGVIASASSGQQPPCPDSPNPARLMLCFQRLARHSADDP
jgi:hypothetical protein